MNEKPFVTKERYEKVIEICRNLALSRNKKYGNSIDIVRNSSILDLCLIKLMRTRKLPEDDPKFVDEIVDCINYLVYRLMRYKK